VFPRAAEHCVVVSVLPATDGLSGPVVGRRYSLDGPGIESL